MDAQLDQKQREDEAETRLKEAVFANNPQLYFKLWPEEVDDGTIEGEEFEWVVPQSEEEAKQLFAQMLDQ